MKTLFINHLSERCGVADYGRRLFDILKPHMDIDYRAISPTYQIDGSVSFHIYDVILVNYHYATLPFLQKIYGIKTVGLFHEAHYPDLFDKVISVQDLPRPLFEGLILPGYNTFGLSTIGSFGFGFPDKDFPRICQLVKEQYSEAIIRLNIPFAEFGDNEGINALNEVEKCRQLLQGTNIHLHVAHQFWSQLHMVNWLSQNDINLFLYKPSSGRGISSTIDYALSAKRPIGISSSEMFRHLPRELVVDNISIPDLIKKGIEPLKKVYEDNSNEKLVAKIKELID